MVFQRKTSLKGLALRVVFILVGLNVLEIPFTIYALNQREKYFGSDKAIESARGVCERINSIPEYIIGAGFEIGSKIYLNKN